MSIIVQKVLKQKCQISSSYYFANSCTMVSNDINYASTIWQKRDIDMDDASTALAKIKSKLKTYRNDFESFKNEASEIAEMI